MTRLTGSRTALHSCSSTPPRPLVLPAHHWYPRLAASLKRLCDDHGIVAICVNQVTDLLEPRSFELQQSGTGRSGNPVIPALGLVWSTCVTMRVMLSRGSRETRKLSVIMAPHLSSRDKVAFFEITLAGISGTKKSVANVDEEEEEDDDEKDTRDDGFDPDCVY